MACWALWQRLPPRYQLTANEEDAELAVNSPRPIHSPRPGQSPRVTSRPKTSGSRPQRSEWVEGEATKGQGQATMYFTVSSPRDLMQTDPAHHSPRPAFPMRRSSFVKNFKQQQRINSARQMFHDPPTPRSYTPTLRTRTAPATPISHQFPVTHLASHQSDDIQLTAQHNNDVPLSSDPDNHIARQHMCQSPRKIEKHSPKTPDPEMVTRPLSRRRRPPSKSAGTRSQPHGQLAVSNVVPFDTTVKPFLKNPLYADQQTRRYVVRGMDNATMFIDNDKVVLIKNNKRQAEYDETTSYIAHLRKLYLQEPKDLAKITKSSKTSKDKDKVSLIRERMEYDKRTDHILNYYNRFNENEQQSNIRGQPSYYYTRSSTSARSSRATSSRERRQPSPPSIPSPTRTRSQSARPIATPSSQPQQYAYQTFEQQQVEAKRDALADWDVFLKINHRSTLHERSQFYLQTPVASPHRETANSSPDCACQLCQLEMDMARKHGKDGPFMFLANPRNTNHVSRVSESPTNQGGNQHAKPDHSEESKEAQHQVDTWSVGKSSVTVALQTDHEGYVIDFADPPNGQHTMLQKDVDQRCSGGQQQMDNTIEHIKQKPPLVIPLEGMSQSGDTHDSESVREAAEDSKHLVLEDDPEPDAGEGEAQLNSNINSLPVSNIQPSDEHITNENGDPSYHKGESASLNTVQSEGLNEELFVSRAIHDEEEITALTSSQVDERGQVSGKEESHVTPTTHQCDDNNNLHDISSFNTVDVQ